MDYQPKAEDLRIVPLSKSRLLASLMNGWLLLWFS